MLPDLDVRTNNLVLRLRDPVRETNPTTAFGSPSVRPFPRTGRADVGTAFDRPTAAAEGMR